MDKENERLKEQLTTLKDEMEDATGKMNDMTEELHLSQTKVEDYKGILLFVFLHNISNVLNNIIYKCCVILDKIAKLEQENGALITQIEEITAQQIDRDKMLDEFGTAIDARISEWKVLIISEKIVLEMF